MAKGVRFVGRDVCEPFQLDQQHNYRRVRVENVILLSKDGLPSKARDLPTQARRIFGRWILLVCFACLPAYAQDTQFLPEIDAHLTFNRYVRGYVQAKDDREGGDPTQFTFGPSVEFYLKPLIKLKSVTAFDLDDAKSRPLILESGYRLITAPNTPNENRLQEAATFRFPLFARILLSDRNRFDLDWKNGSFTWRTARKPDLAG